jgi:hypothetical protein
MNSNNENPTNGKLTPYEWQRAILASDLPSTTKLVLMALSTHLNKETGFAFPSIRMLMEETSLGSEAVVKHIADARRGGWIEISNHGYQDQRWARKSYRPRIPVNLKEGVSPSKTPYDIGVSPSKTPLKVKGVSIEREGVSIEPPFQEAEIALEPAPAVAFSDSPAAPNNILTREEQEREGEIPLSTPPDALSISSTSPQEGEASKAGGDVQAAIAQSAGGDSGLGCQNQAVKIATRANGKPTTGRERQRQGNVGAAQPLPASWALSDDDIKASMKRTGWSEAKVKDEASKFKNRHLSRGTLSCNWAAEWANWIQRGLEYMRANGKLEKTAPTPPIFVAEPKAPIDPSKPRPSLKAMYLEEMARRAAQP